MADAIDGTETQVSATLAEARRQLGSSGHVDRDLLLALRAARGPSLRFLDAREARTLRSLLPSLPAPAAGQRLCMDADAAPHPLIALALHEAQLERLADLDAPEVVLARVRAELDDLRRSSSTPFDWSAVSRYPDDAHRFPAYQHDLHWMRALGTFLAARASGADAERARVLSAELVSANAWLATRAYSGDDRPGAAHFCECALDVLSQADVRTDQDLIEEIAVSALACVTGAEPSAAWTSFFEGFWLPTWDTLIRSHVGALLSGDP